MHIYIYEEGVISITVTNTVYFIVSYGNIIVYLRFFRFNPTFSEKQLGSKTGVSVPPHPHMCTWRAGQLLYLYLLQSLFLSFPWAR
jgi:hypothetical protein